MLFNYRYVPHSIETFQTWLDHLVKEVWCRNTGDYSLDMLHPELKAIVEELSLDDRIGDWLDGPIRKIDAVFKNQLNAIERIKIRTWYEHNNDIEALCRKDPAKIPGTYAQINAINVHLAEALKSFCQSLFTNVINLKAVTSRIGDIDDHYELFVTENDEGKCPYCGCSDIKGNYQNRREAYDHYLPKGVYPFNSVNFRNLAPMCHDCNSSYKLARDPIRNIDPIHAAQPLTRRKAFYSFSDVDPGITVTLVLTSDDIDNLSPLDIDLQITSPGREEEIAAWMDVFGIEERYKAKCLAKNDGKYWLTQAVEECTNAGLTAHEMLQKISRNATESPMAECNFLKKPFLLACHEKGLV